MAKTMLALSLLVGGCASAPAKTSDSVVVPASTGSEPTTTTEAPTTTVPEPTTTTTEAPVTVEEAPVTTLTTRARSAPTTTVYEPPAPQSRTTRQDGGSAPLACIRSYEGDYGTDTGNGYYGAYQFDRQTWASVGGTGNPANASPAEQDMRAQMLYDRRGLRPWPTPARLCA